MRRVFVGRDVLWGILSNRLRASSQCSTARAFCNNIKPSSNNKNGVQPKINDGGAMSHYEAYKQLDNLDFMTAAKIAFSAPKKKFGLDFHLVQLFFVCLPSLAVYLTAQYARYEIRRMEGELEVKKKAEEEAKAKELLLKASEEQEAGSDPELQEVKARLGKLEEAVKEIAVRGSQKQSGSSTDKKQDGERTKQAAAAAPEASNSALEDQTKKETQKGLGQQEGRGSVAIADASLRNQKATPDKDPKK
ncbi:hypothetical protein DCAR_0518645 [Daucus carota subsp. sativus]|uniref:Uncharacterized protein n=2 Tax=Daucus carota subsp. sativus TaxID=79200 RepID=A0AAF0X0J2_DAUCS|nr:PREDICTED: uncharacterized protein LOC108221962 [Daucus carota subsp. sativus]XP_017251323.1 PREDICTED: uncharacterized protein LOC108221962 [Daucus carota subsp. sativus]WOG99297.1 hypothetical protein DCAR_0518645 [Daucus carota subsp. sativus]